MTVMSQTFYVTNSHSMCEPVHGLASIISMCSCIQVQAVVSGLLPSLHTYPCTYPESSKSYLHILIHQVCCLMFTQFHIHTLNRQVSLSNPDPGHLQEACCFVGRHIHHGDTLSHEVITYHFDFGALIGSLLPGLHVHPCILTKPQRLYLPIRIRSSCKSSAAFLLSSPTLVTAICACDMCVCVYVHEC